MIQKTNMTIDAYLRNAGIKSVDKATHKTFLPLKNGLRPTFSEDLSSALSSTAPDAAERKTGLTLSDYLSQSATHKSPRIFANSTMHHGSPQPASLNRFSHAIASSRATRARSDSVSRDSSIEIDAGHTHQMNTRELIADSINDAARKYNLPAKLIESVIQAESNFKVDAVSPAGAQGLMQLMPGTAKELGVEDPFDVRQNIDGGAGYLRQMMNRFGGDVRVALAAYNAGPGTVEKYNGNVPYRETRNYIERVLKNVSA